MVPLEVLGLVTMFQTYIFCKEMKNLINILFIIMVLVINSGHTLHLQRIPLLHSQSLLSLNHRFSCPSRLYQTNLLEQQDSELYQLIDLEYKRQNCGIELIASENFVSPAVQEALGSCLTNKYSEGKPGARYYGGNQYVDAIEVLCQRRALDLFGLSSEEWGVNVQPYSGSPANFAVYTALLQPHDRLMGLDLPSGGHLTHGYQTAKRKVSAASIFFESLPYGVDGQTGLIDYEELRRRVLLFKPKLLIAGASAYSRDWHYDVMRTIADSVGAYLMADISHIAGFVASGLCNNPFRYCDVVTTTTHKSLRGPRSGMIFAKKLLIDKINQAVFPALQGGPHNHQIAAVAVALKEAMSPDYKKYAAQVLKNAKALSSQLSKKGYSIVSGGTENHLFLWDLKRKDTNGLSGSLFEALCELSNISVNKNSLPSDTSAINPGGVRIGTAAITSRGMNEPEMDRIANILHRIFTIGDSLCSNYENTTGEKLKVKELKKALSALPDYLTQLQQLSIEVCDLANNFPHRSTL